MSRLAILILGMALGAAAVVLTFSLWLDPGVTRADSRVHATMSPEELAVAPIVPGPAPSLPKDSALLIPVSGVLARQLSDTFTQSRGAGRLHDALDIMAPRGTPVVAVADGRVAKLFNSKPGGLTVYQFDAEEKLAYYYAHLDSYAPTLVEGQQLGAAMSSAMSAVRVTPALTARTCTSPSSSWARTRNGGRAPPSIPIRCSAADRSDPVAAA